MKHKTIACLAVALLAWTLTVRSGSSPSVGLVSEAAAFDPVDFVWKKFKNGVLDKVAAFIKSPVEKAKKGLKALVDKALEGLKDVFTKNVLGPAMRWALEKVFPASEKLVQYVHQVMGRLETLMDTADKYAQVVDAMIQKDAQRFEAALGGVHGSMDIVQRFNVSWVVDILIEAAKDKALPFVKSKTIDLLNEAFALVEKPIELGKSAAVSALGSIPAVGGVIAGAADFIITNGLKLLRKMGFEIVATKAAEMVSSVIDAIGKQLKNVAAKVDSWVKPALDRVKGFIAKASTFVKPVKDAFLRVQDGLVKARSTLATLRAGAEKLAP